MVNPVLKSRGMMGCITGFPRGSNSVYIRHCLVINARIVGENSSGSNNIGGIFGATYPNNGSTYIQNCGATGSITGYWVYAVMALTADFEIGMSMMKYLYADLEPFGRGFTEGADR